MEVKSCFGTFWVNAKQTPDDLQQLFTPAASLKGKIQKILSIMRQWVEKWSIASPPFHSISLPQPASSSQTDIISHIQIASVCSGRGSWLPFLSSVEIDFSQLSQPAFFWNLCKIYIYKKICLVWRNFISPRTIPGTFLERP